MNNYNDLLKLANSYYKECASLEKEARIRKLPNGKYRVLSEKGKNLGTSDTRAGAEKRLKQVEFFKHRDMGHAEDHKIINLMNATDFSFSAIMREMKKEATDEQSKLFLSFYKKEFDKAYKNKLQKPEKIALQNSLIKFNKLHPIKVKKKLVKNASISELGDANLVGQYLSNIVKFIINKIPNEQRASAMEKLRNKFYSFNAEEIAKKDLPAMSAMGQSITFVKHVLFNHDVNYIKEVLDSLARNLY